MTVRELKPALIRLLYGGDLPSPRAVFKWGLVLGFALYGVLDMCIKDLYGQAAYGVLVRTKWADSRLTMPVQIVMLATVLVITGLLLRRLPQRKS